MALWSWAEWKLKSRCGPFLVYRNVKSFCQSIQRSLGMWIALIVRTHTLLIQTYKWSEHFKSIGIIMIFCDSSVLFQPLFLNFINTHIFEYFWWTGLFNHDIIVLLYNILYELYDYMNLPDKKVITVGLYSRQNWS